MTIERIGRVFRAAPDGRGAVRTLVVAALALLCAVYTEGLAAEASAACRDEVAAAFERLRTSGRPYRKEMTSDVSDRFIVDDRKTFRGTFDFLPPDRMREVTSITNDGIVGYMTSETIRVGARVWSSWWGGWPWGWREWDFRLRDRWRHVAGDGPGNGANATPGFIMADPVIGADAMFECLGRVEFKGTAYLGYRARLEERIIVAMPHNGALSETRQQELSRKLKQMPQKWRTVLVDPQSMLPAYDLAAQENQLDNPSSKERYTYPNDIKIEPPLWCQLGLCSSIPW
jgi:hypothetical protein